MTDAHDEAPLSREQLQERHAAALTALRAAIGDRPTEVATAGELAALLARIPADTPLLVDEHVRIDPDLDESTTETRHAVQATAVPPSPTRPSRRSTSTAIATSTCTQWPGCCSAAC